MKTRIRVCRVIAMLAGALCSSASALLPTNFPPITVTTLDTNRVGEGYVFLAVASVTPDIGTYSMILDNNGTPVWYEENTNTHEIYDFKMQPNGLMSCAPFIEDHDWTGGGDAVHEIRDEGHVLRETVTGGNGYVAESHDFQVLPNGHILQFGYYMSQVDMSELIEGGNPAAEVSGGIIQELDTQRNVVWQWRSWDHYPFEDAASTRNVINAFHLNDIFLDIDGNLVVGTPSSVWKINRQTGDVMWTLGGDDNDFTPIGPDADVSHFGGHATYRIPNGNFLMYDNGNRQATVSSRVHEYTLDEINLTATHVWTWEPTNAIGAWHRGNAQRLPNGNTMIGWGGASGGRHIPACTEVSTNDEVVFELYFDDMSPESQIESYRAFRFPFPPADQAVSDVQYELAVGNEYVFTNVEVTIDVDGLTGAGYNEVQVTREPYAPEYPYFPSKSPQLVPIRVTVDDVGLIAMTAEISFDAIQFGFTDPGNLSIYYRATPGSGVFVPLVTSYNPVTKQLRATMTDFGEFVFGYPDAADIAFPPILCRPENYRGVQTHRVVAPRMVESNEVYAVNQELPILLSWSPKGFARYYELQVDTDAAFTSPVIDLQYRNDAFLVWSDALPDTTYYWRVRTMIDDFSTGDWATNIFQTVAPSIEVNVPNGGEMWQRGLDYFIQWDDNIAEDVVIDLYKGGAYLQTIATNASTGAFEWEADLALAAGNDYAIRVSSATNGALSDISDQYFSIDVPKFTSISVASNQSVSLEWDGTSYGVYVEFNDDLKTNVWAELAGPLFSTGWTNGSPPNAQNGNYRLRLE